MDLTSPEFWIAVGQIILIDVLLGGDNAVVIALACRKLPPKQRTQGILWGTVGAIVLRLALIFFALQLLAIPFLKIAGALLLVWIGVKLLLPEHEDGHANVEGSDRLWGAVKTVIVADFVMSLDNVIAIAGAAENAGGPHTMLLVVFGILVSIPIIVWGSQLVIKLMDRFPIIITLGGMLLGWIAGTMLVTDPAVIKPDVFPSLPKLPEDVAWIRWVAGVSGALLVLALGKWLASRSDKAQPQPVTTVALPTGGERWLQRVLLPQDGSEPAMRALEHALYLQRDLREGPLLAFELVNVQRPLSGDVSSFVGSRTVEEYHRERSLAELEPARQRLQAAGLPFGEHLKVGAPGSTIAKLAQELDCDLIVMGAKGQSAVATMLLGSVAQDTLGQSGVPVMLVR